MNSDQQAIQSAQQESARGNTLDDASLEAIQEDYEKTLFIPTKKYNFQVLLCPIGLVGSGKSTVIKKLCSKLELVRISGDEIRIILKQHGFNYLRTVEIGDRLIEKYLKLGFSVAIDSDCAGKAKDIIQEKIAQYPAIKIIWIHICAPEELIVQRLHARHNPNNLESGSELFNDAEAAVANYIRRKPLHEHLDFPFTYTFDSSKNLDTQIDEALPLIQKLLI